MTDESKPSTSVAPASLRSSATSSDDSFPAHLMPAEFQRKRSKLRALGLIFLIGPAVGIVGMTLLDLGTFTLSLILLLVALVGAAVAFGLAVREERNWIISAAPQEPFAGTAQRRSSTISPAKSGLYVGLLFVLRPVALLFSRTLHPSPYPQAGMSLATQFVGGAIANFAVGFILGYAGAAWRRWKGGAQPNLPDANQTEVAPSSPPTPEQAHENPGRYVNPRM